MPFAKKILIAPLDWGLGHTTRCIPIIRYLRSQNCEVWAAAEGNGAILMQDNFPDIKILPLKGYGIRYNNTQQGFTRNIVKQIPKIIRSIRYEHQWLKSMQDMHKFDAVISDNRYGMYHHQIPSVIITHQLRIQSGLGNAMDNLLQSLHYNYLERFNYCWVPDEEHPPYLSGILGHPKALPKNVHYIGLLSQLNLPPHEEKINDNKIAVLLSGPEPQRSLLESKLLLQIKELTQFNFVIIGGNPSGNIPNPLPPHITYHTYLNASEVSNHIIDAALVICRSGYSTLMDLGILKKKALLIPTPGQTEQEYLAKFLQEKNIALSVMQKDLSLKNDLLKAFEMDGLVNYNNVNKSMEKMIESWLKHLS